MLSGLGEPRAYYHYSGYYHCNWGANGKVIADKVVATEEEFGSDNPQYGTSYIVEIDLDHSGIEQVVSSHSVANVYAKKTDRVWQSVTSIESWESDGEKGFVYRSYDYNNRYTNNPDTRLSKMRFYNNNILLKTVEITPIQGTSTVGSEGGVEVLSYNSVKDMVLLSFYGHEFIVFSTKGELIKRKSEGGRAIWKDGNHILFYNKTERKLSAYNLESDSFVIYPISFIPEWYNASDNSVYCVDNGDLKKCNLTTFEVSTLKRLNYDFESLKYHYFSPDGNRLLLTKFLYSGPYDRGDSSGIYTYNLETDVLTKIRD